MELPGQLHDTWRAFQAGASITIASSTQTGSAGAGAVGSAGSEGRVPLWVQYNDEKVVRSAAPPTQLAYIYLFARVHD